MTPQDQTTLLVDGMVFLESPRWHDGQLFVADFYGDTVYSVSAAGHLAPEATVPHRPGGLGWLSDDTMLVVSRADRRILRRERHGLVTHADMSALMTGDANDMVVSGSGVAYVGNMGFDLAELDSFAPAPLVRVDPDGHCEIASEPLFFANGSVITPDGRTLVVAETMANRLSAFTIEADGSLGARRDWTVFGPPPSSASVAEIIATAVVGADGICLDAHGAVWVADSYHHRVLRVEAGGDVTDVVELGALNAYAVALGGSDNHTLFLCVAQSPFEQECRRTRSAGICWITVDVPAP